MELMTTNRYEYESDSIDKFETQMKEMNLIYYASEASREINFRNPSEFPIAVNRAMEIISNADISLDHNFKQIYKCSDSGIFCDWKLSTLAYKLVCLNLDELIPEELQKEIELLKNKC